jgi:hypothetical protein
LEAKIAYFRRVKKNEEDARLKRERASKRRRGRFGRLQQDEAEDNEKSGRGSNRYQ